MARTLIPCGTAGLCRAVAAHALTQGHEVTCLARGNSGSVPDGVALVTADRSLPDAYREVSSTDWDEVIEIAWAPDLVDGAHGPRGSSGALDTRVLDLGLCQQPGRRGSRRR